MLVLPVVNCKGRQRPSVLGALSKIVLIRLSALHRVLFLHCFAVRNHTLMKEPYVSRAPAATRRDPGVAKFSPEHCFFAASEVFAPPGRGAEVRLFLAGSLSRRRL